MATENPRAHVQELLADFHTGMLVTHASSERFHARPMAIADRDANGDVWFVTSGGAPKVAEAREDGRALLTMQSQSKWVTLGGHLEIVNDRAKIDELWNDGFKVWFPKGKDDPSLTLMHLVTDEAEYWDQSGLKGVKYALAAAKAFVKGERVEANDPAMHATVKLS